MRMALTTTPHWLSYRPSWLYMTNHKNHGSHTHSTPASTKTRWFNSNPFHCSQVLTYTNPWICMLEGVFQVGRRANRSNQTLFVPFLLLAGTDQNRRQTFITSYSFNILPSRSLMTRKIVPFTLCYSRSFIFYYLFSTSGSRCSHVSEKPTDWVLLQMIK